MGEKVLCFTSSICKVHTLVLPSFGGNFEVFHPTGTTHCTDGVNLAHASVGRVYFWPQRGRGVAHCGRSLISTIALFMCVFSVHCDHLVFDPVFIMFLRLCVIVADPADEPVQS